MVSAGSRRVLMAFAMIVVSAVSTGTTFWYKMAFTANRSMTILVSYRYLTATAVTVPFAYHFERAGRAETPFTWHILLLSLICGIFNAAGETLTAFSYGLSSAASIGAISNMAPALTFIIAVACRIERLQIGTWSGWAKIAGTAITIAGGLTSILYQGKTLSWRSPLDVLHIPGAVVWDTSSDQTGRGFLFNIAGCICSSVTLLAFSRMSRDYPRLTSTAIMCGVTAISSTVFSLVFEHRHWAAWEITPDIASLVPILYTGLFSTGLNICIVAWCARAQGAVFVSSFGPVGLVFNIILGWGLFGEMLHVGSIVGGVILVAGVGTVLYAQSREANKATQAVGSTPAEPQPEP